MGIQFLSPSARCTSRPCCSGLSAAELAAYCDYFVLSGCTVVAGEFAGDYQGEFSPGGYIWAYGQELLRVDSSLPPVAYPTVWGFHAYHDLLRGWRAQPPRFDYPYNLATECTSDLQPQSSDYLDYAFQQSDCYVNYFAGAAGNGWDQGPYWHYPSVWLDEEGVQLENGGVLSSLDANYTGSIDNPNYPNALGVKIAGHRQVAAAKEFYDFASRYCGLVTGIFYFAWGPGATGSFDSALMDASDQPRLAYCVLVSERLNKCPGSRTAG